MLFTENQIKFMQEIGVSVVSFDDLTDADYELIEEKVSNHLQKNGFDANYGSTEAGKMCESILDLL